jgi:division protein CdvB (Snf7/Vps24/ESCRT-III family)
MKGVVKSMDDMMAANMDVVKMTQILDKFEVQFQDLDVLDKSMATSFDSTLATTTPEMDVENLMYQVADEHGLEFESELEGVGKVKAKEAKTTTTTSAPQEIALGGDDAPTPPKKGPGPAAAPSGGNDPQLNDLEARLRRLQGL